MNKKIANIKETQELLRKVKEHLRKADATLTKFEQDQENEQWLTNLRRKIRIRKLDENKKQKKAGLKEKEKVLKDDVRNYTKHIKKLQLKLTSTAQTGNNFMT